MHTYTHTRHQRKTTAAAEVSVERRLSLYDVLTGESPLPPRREGDNSGAADAAAASTMNGGRFHGNRCSDGGRGDENGVAPLGGGARRASIFDRIADVVFNEAQKDQNPVDAVAVRWGGLKSVRLARSGSALRLQASFLPASASASASASARNWGWGWGPAGGRGGWRLNLSYRIYAI